MSGSFFSLPAIANDHGCTVLLCLAAPFNPTKIPECASALAKLFVDLLKFKPFPSCLMASGSNSFAKQTTTYYLLCPDGLTELGSGRLAMLGVRVPDNPAEWGPRQQLFVGIGSGDDIRPGEDSSTGGLPMKVCVGDYVGSISFERPMSGDNLVETVSVDLYNNVVQIDAGQTKRAIDVYVDGVLVNRMHW